MAKQLRPFSAANGTSLSSSRRSRVESPKRGEVMIKIGAAASATATSATNGTIPLPPPVVLGHECCRHDRASSAKA